MGAAEVVPGVSGGTIAFVSGFYERLVNGIARLTPFSLLELPKIGFAAWWKKYDLGFLFVLFGAMLVSILILARGVSYLLAEHPVGIWSFFFGLVLSSIFVVGRLLLPLSVESGLALGVGVAVGHGGGSCYSVRGRGFRICVVCGWLRCGVCVDPTRHVGLFYAAGARPLPDGDCRD